MPGDRTRFFPCVLPRQLGRPGALSYFLLTDSLLGLQRSEANRKTECLRDPPYRSDMERCWILALQVTTKSSAQSHPTRRELHAQESRPAPTKHSYIRMMIVRIHRRSEDLRSILPFAHISEFSR